MAEDAPSKSTSDLDLAEKKWQIRSTQVAMFVTLAGLFAGGVKYFEQRKQALDDENHQREVQSNNARRESQKPFLQKQLDTCFNAVSVVGSLAAEYEPGVRVKPEAHAKALYQFWIHYHGVLSVVEDDTVENAMVALGKQLRACEEDHAKCDLQTNANLLAHGCRDITFKGWDVTNIQYNK